MSAIKKTRAKLILFLLLLAVPASVLPAADYDELMRDGTLEEITAAFKKDGEMHRAKIGDEKDSLLMRAVKYGRTESVVALLLKAGVSVSAKNKDGRTALMYACLHSHDAAVIRLLLEKSGSRRSVRKKLLQADSFGKSALDYARLNPSPAALSLIEPYLTEGDLKASSPDSEYGADAQPFLEQTARTVFSPYSSVDGASALEAEEDEIPPPAEEPAGAVETQEEDGASPDAAAAAADTSVPAAVLPPSAAGQLLADAAPGGRLDKDTEAVLEPSGADVGGYQKMYLYDYAPQEDAGLPSDAEPSDFPLAAIDNPNQSDAFGRTRLMLAVKAGNDWEIRSLLRSGADVNLADRDGWTALMYAVRYQNNAAVVDILLEHGAKVKAANQYGATPLQLAAAYTENPEILNRILEEYQSGSNDVFKAFIMAISSGSQNSMTQLAKIRLFLDKNVSVNRFYEGRTPLMYAAEFSSSTEVIKLLLERGATPSIRAADGRRAFDYAAANTNLAHDETYWALNARQQAAQ